ncbi:uncharacterized protein CCOS01_09601 [Colletotrichum costaricense]|uniref:Uncharacterized protein n=1 Tax=Colletotrichum costaricense TaxID=1209916 RepID=A0AAI9YV23_9PEZI|nr:uncharacterized protein CCOS01_09601 [Colletotrichum costaricense]KAK1524514.1 hypothetical protein CCOS01_09601 [Colletotrichum costaricense]
MRLPNILVVAMLLSLGATAALPVEDVTDMTDFEDVANDAMAKPPPHKVEKPWMMWGVRKPPNTSMAICTRDGGTCRGQYTTTPRIKTRSHCN